MKSKKVELKPCKVCGKLPLFQFGAGMCRYYCREHEEPCKTAWHSTAYSDILHSEDDWLRVRLIEEWNRLQSRISCSNCIHVGQETADDVAFCNCCEGYCFFKDVKEDDEDDPIEREMEAYYQLITARENPRGIEV